MWCDSHIKSLLSPLTLSVNVLFGLMHLLRPDISTSTPFYRCIRWSSWSFGFSPQNIWHSLSPCGQQPRLAPVGFWSVHKQNLKTIPAQTRGVQCVYELQTMWSEYIQIKMSPNLRSTHQPTILILSVKRAHTCTHLLIITSCNHTAKTRKSLWALLKKYVDVT